MGVIVEIRTPHDYPKHCIPLLQELFADSKKVTVTKQFTEGQSGAFVLLVEPTDQNDECALPVVVKIGPSHLLEQEHHAAQQYMVGRLPDFVPINGPVVTVSMNDPNGIPRDYSAVRYALAGNGIFSIETLREYMLTAPQDVLWTVLEKRLFQQFDPIWTGQSGPQARCVGATYDRVLPVNLLLEYTTTVPEDPITLDGTQNPATYPAVQPNNWVKLDNFVISEIESTEHALTLNRPSVGTQSTDALSSSAYRLRIQNVADSKQYTLHETISGLIGRVVTTRQLLLLDAVRHVLPRTIDLSQPFVHLPPDDKPLPNPLLLWPTLLMKEMPMRTGTVHGDFNTGNVLIDIDAKSTFTIDCVHARRDHALYDLVRLESEIVLHLVATRFYEQNLPPITIHELYNWLDFVTQRDPNPSGFFSIPQPLVEHTPTLQSAFIALTTIRNAARRYLAQSTQWREYYVALALTLLGSLKFATLDRAPAGMNPKAVAFWGVATLLAQLEQPVNMIHIGWQRVAVHEVATATAGGDKPGVYVGYTDASHDQRQGVFFENNESVRIEGNVIEGGTINTANFHGPVTGPVHTGSGDIHVNAGR